MLIPVFKPLYNLFSYFSCKVTTGTYNLQSAMLNFKSDGLSISVTAAAGILPCTASLCSLIALSVNIQF